MPEDELGNGYEYLIKKFADDSGHTAAEFYTNRTVVHLMTEMLQPQPGESIYDPDLRLRRHALSCVAHLAGRGRNGGTLRLFGQERNLITSAIARMNCSCTASRTSRSRRETRLADPKFVEGDRLQQFDLFWPTRRTPSNSGTARK